MTSQTSGSKKQFALQSLPAFVLPLILFTGIMILRRITPFGDNTFFYDDMKRQYVDFYSYYRQIFRSNNNFIYSFSAGLGANMVGFSAYYLTSPLLLPFIFIPQQALPEAVTALIAVKVSLCGLTSFWYLRSIEGGQLRTGESRGAGAEPVRAGQEGGSAAAAHAAFRNANAAGTRADRMNIAAALVLSASYALCEFNALNVSNIMWLDVLILFPVMMILTRRMLRDARRSWIWYCLALALSLFCNYYITYMTLLYLAMYILLYAGSVRKMVRAAAATFLAAGMSAWLMVPTAMSLLRSGKNASRYGIANPQPNLRPSQVISKFFSLSYDTTQIFDGNPQVYCGMLVLFGCMFFFLNKEIDRKEKLRRGILLAALFVSFCVEIINRVWHAGTEPEGYLYRYSFLFSLLAITCAYAAFVHRKALTRRSAILCAAFVLILWVIAAEDRDSYFGTGKAAANLVLILLTGGLITAWLLLERRGQEPGRVRCRRAAMICAGLLCLVQLADLGMNFTYVYMVTSQGQMTASAFRAKTAHDAPLLRGIMNTDSGFYRIENTAPRTENDAMMYGYNGVSVYSSDTLYTYRTFLTRLGYNDNMNFASYTTGNTEEANRIFGIRYILDGDTVKEAENPLPVIFGLPRTQEQLQKNADFNYDAGPFDFSEGILSAYAGEKVQTLFPAAVISRSTSADERHKGRYRMDFTLRAASDGDMYFYVTDLDHIDDMILTVNGKELPQHFGNLSCKMVLRLGNFQKGSTVRVEIGNIVKLPSPDTVQFVSEDMERVEDVCGRIGKYGAKVSKLSSSHLLAEVPKGASSLVLAIPYEEGWQIFVDGKRAEAKPLFDLFMSVPLGDPDTAHSVELRYVPAGMKAGAAVSAVSVTLFLAAILYEERRRRAGKS